MFVEVHVVTAAVGVTGLAVGFLCGFGLGVAWVFRAWLREEDPRA